MDLREHIKSFYGRNLFERVVLYVFMAEFFVQLFFEILLGMSPLAVVRHVQWVFYALLGLDYLVSWRKVINIQVTLNPMSILGFVFLIMVAHGLFMGVSNHNRPFEILNDTIPLLMIALNIFRMQSLSEERQVDFSFMLKSCTFFAAASCFLGFAANKAIGNSMPKLAGDVTYLPLLVTALYAVKPFPKKIFVISILMLVLVGQDFNRTSMAFLAFAALVGISINVIQKPMVGVAAMMMFCLLIAAAVHFVPEDSKTYRRVTGLMELDLSARKGSVGERGAEWDAINAKLEDQGRTVEYLGLGFGGLYEVARTHEYLKDYGHAHYSWAWFNLRFGRSGYIYLAIMVFALCYNCLSGLILHRTSKTGLWIGTLSFFCLLYCVTYVNAVFLISGVQFLRVRRDIDMEHSQSENAPLNEIKT